MNSSLSFIYESIMSLITNIVLEVFNDIISDIIIEVLMEVVNTIFNVMEEVYSAHGKQNAVASDIRFYKVKVQD